jgi:hypothetical protein
MFTADAAQLFLGQQLGQLAIGGQTQQGSMGVIGTFHKGIVLDVDLFSHKIIFT